MPLPSSDVVCTSAAQGPGGPGEHILGLVSSTLKLQKPQTVKEEVTKHRVSYLVDIHQGITMKILEIVLQINHLALKQTTRFFFFSFLLLWEVL